MLKIFLKLIFIVAPVMLVIFLSEILIDDQLLDNSSYQLNPSIKTLILGHSHPECSIDDSIVQNTINLSQSGESYFYTYYKARKIISTNPQIRTVVIEFTNNVFKIQDDWTYNDDYLLFKYCSYSQLIPFDEKVYLLYKNPFGYLDAYIRSVKSKYMLLYSDKKEFFKKLCWGGYLPLIRNQVPNIEKPQNRVPKSIANPEIKVGLLSKINYLRMIVEFCKSRNVKVILLRSPLHPYYKRINEAEMNYLLCHDFKDIPFWDYSNYPLRQHEYGDLEHLNKEGAKVFSKTINVRLKEHLRQ